jgi:hypothetical protein
VLLDRKLMRQAHHYHHTALAIDITDFVGRRLGVVHRIRYPRRRLVARWYVGSKVETTGSVFQVREDEPAPRIGAGLHRTP